MAKKVSMFGRKLAELRASANLTQRQLADLAGVQQPHIARIESGDKAHPSWVTVCILADALGISTESFRFPGDTEKKSEKSAN